MPSGKPRCGQGVIERFVKVHTDEATARGAARSFKWAANHVGSFLAVVRFVGTTVEVAPAVVASLEALHKQTLQQSRVQAKFSVGKPVAWLDWPAVLRARVAAERALAAYEGEDLDERLVLTRTVLMMRLHSDQPPYAPTPPTTTTTERLGFSQAHPARGCALWGRD